VKSSVVVVFGSSNLDLVARVTRLPVPGETLLGTAFVMTPGGKGANQALAARRAGAQVKLYAHVGSDALAAEALALLRDSGVDLAGVTPVPGGTGVALIHVDARGENAITVVPGANSTVRATMVPDSALVPGNTLVLQLEAPIAEVAIVAQRARTRGARVLLNAAPAATLPAGLLHDVDVLLVNDTEAAALARDLGVDGVNGLCERLATTECVLIVTRGAEGVLYAAGGEITERVAPRVQVVDTVGAGDAFAGALAAALDRGADLDRAISEALAAGALACTRAGAQAAMPLRDEIRALADTL
jgi:ribokinase